jgi:uncharacterized protein YkwD
MKAVGLTSTGMIVLCLLPAAPAMARVTPAERALVRTVSQIRAAHGLAPVRRSRSLARSAGRYSRWQLRHDYFGHQPRIRMSGRFGVGGEVLRWVPSWRIKLRRTVRLWMRSPSHRAALLHPGMRRAGAGIVRGRLHGRLALMVTMHLGGR